LTIIGVPIWAETCTMTRRAITSVALPGVKGTIRRIGFAGHPCAQPFGPPKTLKPTTAASNQVSLAIAAPRARFTRWVVRRLRLAIYHVEADEPWRLKPHASKNRG